MARPLALYLLESGGIGRRKKKIIISDKSLILYLLLNKFDCVRIVNLVEGQAAARARAGNNLKFPHFEPAARQLSADSESDVG